MPVVAIVSIGTLFSLQVQKWGKLVPFFYVKSCPSISDKEMYGNSTCTSAACLLQRKRGAFAGQQSPYRHGYVYAGPVGRSGWSSGSSGTSCRNQHGHCVWLLVPRRSSPVSAVRSTRYRPTTCFVRGCRRQRHCVHPSVQEKSTPQIPVSEPHFLRLINNFLNRTRPISPIFYCKQISWFL
jgi:hypothetical protein